MTEKGKKIIAEACKNPKLSEALKNVKSKEEAVKFLNNNGFACSLEDFADEKGSAKNGKVSLEEAAAVAGGTTCACVIGGGGTHTCACALIGEGGPGDGSTVCYCVGGGGSSW